MRSRYRHGRTNDKLRQPTHSTRNDPPTVEHRYRPHGSRDRTQPNEDSRAEPCSDVIVICRAQ